MPSPATSNSRVTRHSTGPKLTHFASRYKLLMRRHPESAAPSCDPGRSITFLTPPEVICVASMSPDWPAQQGLN
ncbi:hypothetical protein E2C01_011521 [Portunus trituberculatus]|uniref:Uncharacterized protein n=1 Tax=Portunus trituberculatus TaxID=210409 RepID=A0A5B7DBF1_PORTR|nr:hypothetical protein [Portunus trituberculatus]